MYYPINSLPVISCERSLFVTAAQLLEENQIIEIVSKLKEQKFAVNGIKLKYNFQKNVMFLEPVGVRSIIDDEDYFLNIEDNLTYANLCYLSSIAKEIKTNFDVNMTVCPDGSIDHENVEFIVKLNLPLHLKRNQFDRFVYPIFRKILPFRQFLTNCEFKGHEHHIKFIIFHLKLNGKKVTPILNQKALNNQVLAQWITAFDYITQYNQSEYGFEENIPVLNGRISLATFETTLRFKFTGRLKR